ncbi:uncharacterized protein BJX67DRAFT_77459 [Aspergillus lucknowensis]|uniref:Uncharacterized protein n=1 Tax=Aspergillus lucknowensis TaxID=176173 RepID=A0ABR4LTC5_9EURO
MQPYPTQDDPEYSLYLGIYPKDSLHDAHWALLLIHPDSTTCDVYQSVQTPNQSIPYDRKMLKYQDISDITSDSAYCGRLGTIQADDKMKFSLKYFDTVPGPSQFFVLRFLFALAEEGLVEQLVVRDVARIASYSAGELEEYGDMHFPADREFLDAHGGYFAIPERDGKAFG